MKKITWLSLAAGLIAFCAPAVFADDAKDAKPADKPNREELREKLKNMTPEERRDYIQKHRDELKDLRGPGGPGAPGGFNREDMEKRRAEFAKKLGLDPEELKKLKPEEARAKIKEAVEKRTAELEKKQTDGTITDEEKKALERMKEMKARGPGGPGGPGGGHGKKERGEKSDEKKSDDKK